MVLPVSLHRALEECATPRIPPARVGVAVTLALLQRRPKHQLRLRRGALDLALRDALTPSLLLHPLRLGALVHAFGQAGLEGRIGLRALQGRIDLLGECREISG